MASIFDRIRDFFGGSSSDTSSGSYDLIDDYETPAEREATDKSKRYRTVGGRLGSLIGGVPGYLLGTAIGSDLSRTRTPEELTAIKRTSARFQADLDREMAENNVAPAPVQRALLPLQGTPTEKKKKSKTKDSDRLTRRKIQVDLGTRQDIDDEATQLGSKALRRRQFNPLGLRRVKSLGV